MDVKRSKKTARTNLCNARRRGLVKGLASGLALSSTPLLSACSSDRDVELRGANSQNGAPGGSAEPVLPVSGDRAIFYPPETEQIITLSDEDGRLMQYTGSVGEASEVNARVDSVTYIDPVAPERSYIYEQAADGSSASLRMIAGPSIELSRTNDDVAFTLRTKGPDGQADVYASTLSSLKAMDERTADATLSGRRAVITRSGFLTVTPANDTPTADVRLPMARVQTGNRPGVNITVPVSGTCGVVSTGLVQIAASPETNVGIGDGGALFNDVNLMQVAHYDAERLAFTTKIPLDAFPSNLKALGQDVAGQTYDAVKEAIQQRLTGGLSAPLEFILDNVSQDTSLPSSTQSSVGILRVSYGAVQKLQKFKDNVYLTWNFANDAYDAVVDRSAFAPVRITATFIPQSFDPNVRDVIESQVVDDISQISDIEIPITADAGSGTPQIADAMVAPKAPASGEAYSIMFTVSCSSSQLYSVRAAVQGTDGYTDSMTYAVETGQTYELSVPGAEAGVRDAIQIEVLNSNDQVVNETDLTVRFR